jgi:hypothetical protein|tara:strand:- start:697 stop:936 length:240 start_codon:yes stop_codon:yes gene_type:complete
MDRIMSDFQLIETEDQYKKFEQELQKKGGVFDVEICNAPSTFPSLVAYSYSNDINGRRMILKHMNVEEVFNKIKKYVEL